MDTTVDSRDHSKGAQDWPLKPKEQIMALFAWSGLAECSLMERVSAEDCQLLIHAN